MDGQAECTIQTLEDMLRSCVIDFKGSWDNNLPLIEFSYINSYQSSIKMAPYEALYGCRCRSPTCWFNVDEAALIGPDSVHDALENVKFIRDRLKTAQSRQNSYADVRRRDLDCQVDEWDFLKVSPMKGVMIFGKKWKLSPRYRDPYKILKRVGFMDRETDHSPLTCSWTQHQPRSGGPQDLSRVVDHLTDHTSTHGGQAESTIPRRQTTGPFTGHSPDNGPW
ncbi:hypothetical protein MTR67_026308 [Solanum verrucosum]|uniref:Uncharacterized protein n=1 Tax=Solanum verrucosum TaxID=315347 RepID=A0AAF0R1F5_SOLVR|nr:hypothetical protein MTR67_026308 [Solanum verrucosum]